MTEDKIIETRYTWFEKFPHNSIHAGTIMEAEFFHSKTGRPMIKVKLENNHWIYIGPIHWLKICIDTGAVPKEIGDKFSMNSVWAIWDYLPRDPAFIVGRLIVYQARHITYGNQQYLNLSFKAMGATDD